MKDILFLVLVFVVPVAACNRADIAANQPRNDPPATSYDPSSLEDEWQFDSPKNLAVITLDRIMDGTHPILHVTHDADDGGWQFLDGGDVSEEDAMVVSLREVADHDPTIRQLADLPIGWYAVRDGVGKRWQRRPSE